MIKHLSLEGGLPRGHSWGFTVKYENIPLIPKAPCSNHEYFHKERLAELLLGNV
jgi:hypothetical protein